MPVESVGCLLFLLFVGGIGAVVILAVRSGSKKTLERRLWELEGKLEELKSGHQKLHARLLQVEQGGPLAPAAGPVVAAPPPPLPAPPSAPLPEPVPQVPPPVQPITQPMPLLQPQPAAPAPPPLPDPPPLRPPVAPPVAPPAAPPSAPEPATSWSFDWESLVGVRLFSWIAGIAMLVAAVTFLRYSIEHGWLSPPVRLAIGIATGIGLLAACESRRAQRYGVTAHALTAAGIATLFASFYSAHALWHLLGAIPAFGLLVLVTAVAVLLSIRRDSIFIALLGLLGGFSTPALLSTGEDHPFGLFGYLLLLNAGLSWVAYKKRWPLLTALSTGFIALYQLGWVLKFLREGNLGTAAGIFLVFPLFAFTALAAGSRKDTSLPALFRHAGAFGALPPLLFALHLAAVPAYGAHTGLLFGFLFLVALGLAVVAGFQGPEWLHPVGAGSVLIVFATWLAGSYGARDWPLVLALVALFEGLYLGWPWLQERLDRPFWDSGRVGVYAAPLLLFVFPWLALAEPATAGPGRFFGSLLALAALNGLHALRSGQGPVHFLACFFVLAAEAIWSARHLGPSNLLPALLVYAGFAVYYLGVPLLARARGCELQPRGGGAVLVFVSLGLLFFLAVGPLAAVSLWTLAVLLGILNLGLLYEASCGRNPWLAPLGLALSWIILAVWWVFAPVAGLLVSALSVMGGLAVLGVGGTLWARAQAEAHDQAVPSAFGASGLLLGLAGHVFLFPVVAQPSLALPPWPWLGVLLVLLLAVGIASLHLRKGAIHLLSMLLGGLLLVAWTSLGVPRAPVAWLGTALASALGLGLLGLLLSEAARRLDLADRTFRDAAGVALLLGQLVLVVAGNLRGAGPDPAFFLAAHALLAAGYLVLGARGGDSTWAVGGAASFGLALFFWQVDHPTRWQQLLALAAPPYLLHLAYPLLLGGRAREDRKPWLAAVVASAVFFLAARQGLVRGGYGDVIGALPVLQALALVPLLLRLLRLQPEGERDQGRLVLVAGAILAFVTAAIPLQLEKEWITLGWALQAVALAWLHGRIPHRGLLLWIAGLTVLVFARLALNPAVLAYHAKSAVPVFNWYLYTYLGAAGAFFASARLLRDQADGVPGLPRLSTVQAVLAAVLLFLLLNIEIADYFSTGRALTIDLLGGGLAQGLSYTIGWAVYGIGLLVAGLALHNRPTRVAAIVLVTVTIAKAFLYDLRVLTGLYRVAAFVGLAICLSLVAVMLQKFILQRTEGEG